MKENRRIRKALPGKAGLSCLLFVSEILVDAFGGGFAGGDAVTGSATVILAMGAGKAAAKSIDEYLRNKK